MTEDNGQAAFLLPPLEERPAMVPDVDDYPDDWPSTAAALKTAMGFRCEVCGHVEGCDDLCHHTGAPRNRAITVHHLDMDKENLSRDNLVVACQVCHLVVQGRQRWPFIVYQEPLMRLPSWMLWRIEARRIKMGIPTKALYAPPLT